MNPHDLKRLRASMLSSLYFSGTLSVSELQQDLQRTHGIVATSAAVRAALHYLDQQGLLQTRDDRAQLTEMGRDVGALRVPYQD